MIIGCGGAAKLSRYDIDVSNNAGFAPNVGTTNESNALLYIIEKKSQISRMKMAIRRLADIRR